MGLFGVKGRKIDECTSNSSLSNLRYVAVEKSKWKLFRKKHVVAIPMYHARTLKQKKGCPCGSDSPCKQTVTPNGVTIHYPQKRRTLGRLSLSKSATSRTRPVKIIIPTPKTEIVRPRKFPVWSLRKIF